MNTQITFVNGTSIEINEFNASKIKGKVQQNPNVHVVIHIEDVEGNEYLFPFNNVAYMLTAAEKDEQAADDSQADKDQSPSSDEELETFEDIKAHVAENKTVAALQQLIEKEEAAPAKRTKVIKFLKDTLAQLKDE